MDTLFGLPAHPLIVHLPIVAIPTLAVVAILVALRTSARERYGLAVIAFGIVTTIATFLAAASGTSLAEEVGKVESISSHQQHGETLRLLVLLVTILLILQVVDLRKRGPQRDATARFFSLAIIIAAVLSVVWTVLTGHSGAESVWGFLS